MMRTLCMVKLLSDRPGSYRCSQAVRPQRWHLWCSPVWSNVLGSSLRGVSILVELSRRCSQNRVFKDLVVSPMYALSHSLQLILYTNPNGCSFGDLFLGLIRICCRVLNGEWLIEHIPVLLVEDCSQFVGHSVDVGYPHVSFSHIVPLSLLVSFSWWGLGFVINLIAHY